jgi:2-keto-4-pentenoate hydratase/2-oxohepta-3-ene-1,7-dioic acid hydratase in catechol pathway
MKVAQFTHAEGSCIGVELDGRWMNYSKAEAAYAMIQEDLLIEPMTSLAASIQTGDFSVDGIKAVLQFVKSHRLQAAMEVPRNAVMKAPIGRPPKIVALGLNYALHAKEGNFQVPKEPIIFSKAGSSVIGPGEPIRIPRGLGRIDHEAELAVIIGKKATQVKRKDALKYVAGFTVLNDVSARDLQTKDLEKKHPWFRSKSFDTFTPLGPWMVTPEEFTMPIHLDVECRVNGEIRQKANTKYMVFDIPTQIEFISRLITLEPGDIISTGTPEGIGPIKNGDRVTCRVERIGELKNPVRYR